MFRLQIKDKGLDPSLINYSNPLIHKKLWPLRWFLLVGFIFIYLVPLISYLLLGLVFFTGVIQLIILYLFGRLPTQPAVYYAGVAISSLGLSFSHQPHILVLVAGIVIFEELYLKYYWARNRQVIYNKWARQRTLRLYERFNGILTVMPAKQRFAVLHVATTEDIARPTIVRLAETIYFRLKHPPIISSGIMQVADSSLLSDEESIRRGAKIIKASLDSMPSESTNLHQHMLWLSQSYNGSQGYATYLEATYPGVLEAWAKINTP